MDILVRWSALVSSWQHVKLEIWCGWAHPYKTIAKFIVHSIVTFSFFKNTVTISEAWAGPLSCRRQLCLKPVTGRRFWYVLGFSSTICLCSPFQWCFCPFPPALLLRLLTGPGSAVGNVSGYRCVSDCRSRDHEFDSGTVPYFRGDWSWNNFYGHSPPFRWSIQEGLLSVTSESMCTNYWLTACSSLPRKKCG